MFEKLAAPDDVIAMRLGGKLTGEDASNIKLCLTRNWQNTSKSAFVSI
ncbi:MAG: hypothetical protein ABI284_08960 [Nitrosospira sp.]